MFEQPSKALMTALRDFVFRHTIFVEAREFDDGLIFVRQPKSRSKRAGPRRNFEVFLRRARRRVRCFTLTCGSEDHDGFRSGSTFPRRRSSGRRKLRLSTKSAAGICSVTLHASPRILRQVTRSLVMYDRNRGFLNSSSAISRIDNSSELCGATAEIMVGRQVPA